MGNTRGRDLKSDFKQFDACQALRDVQHFGEEGGVVPVIDVAVTSTFLDPEDMEKTFRGEREGCYLYSRHQNPTVLAFSKKLAAMENMQAAVGVASGLAAVACTIDQLTRAGDHIISSSSVYGGTYAFFANILSKRGLEISFVDTNDAQAVQKALRPTTKVIYTESMSNPLLAVADLPSLAATAKSIGAQLVVDNTFTPLIISPARFGADVVIHSATKYISGGSDMIAGAIAGSHEFIKSLLDVNSGSIMLNGPVMDARMAHELYLRLDHLPLRMRAHSEFAYFLSSRMEEAGVRVLYPALKSHAHHDLFKSLADSSFGAGGVLTIDCGSKEKALRLAKTLQDEKFGLYAVSLGFSRTLMSCPSLSTSSEIPEAERNKSGMTDSLLRLSIGYTGNLETQWKRFYAAAQAVGVI